MSFSHKSIRDLGFGFNEAGQLRKIDPSTGSLTDIPFQFNVSEKPSENQRNYEELGEAITDYVYERLQTEAGLIKLSVPKTGDKDLRSFIYASEDALTNKDKLLVLIHGSGVVRAGQWARSIIINDNFEYGTQLPYIKHAKSLGYGILVLNSNDNQRVIGEKQFLIPLSSTPEEHANYVWSEYIKNSPAKFIAVVAHSYGGVVTIGLAQKFPEFLQRVKAIAMTDSVHSFRREGISSKVEAILKQIGKNWISSHDPIDVKQSSPEYEIPRVSAGHSKHEMTSHSAFPSVFKFLEDKYQQQN